MNRGELLDWLRAACEHEQDLEARREYGLMIGYAAAGQMSHRACRAAIESHIARAQAWRRVLTAMSVPPVETREAVEVAS